MSSNILCDNCGCSLGNQPTKTCSNCGYSPSAIFGAVNGQYYNSQHHQHLQQQQQQINSNRHPMNRMNDNNTLSNSLNGFGDSTTSVSSFPLAEFDYFHFSHTHGIDGDSGNNNQKPFSDFKDSSLLLSPTPNHILNAADPIKIQTGNQFSLPKPSDQIALSGSLGSRFSFALEPNNPMTGDDSALFSSNSHHHMSQYGDSVCPVPSMLFASISGGSSNNNSSSNQNNLNSNFGDILNLNSSSHDFIFSPSHNASNNPDPSSHINKNAQGHSLKPANVGGHVAGYPMQPLRYPPLSQSYAHVGLNSIAMNTGHHVPLSREADNKNIQAQNNGNFMQYSSNNNNSNSSSISNGINITGNNINSRNSNGSNEIFDDNSVLITDFMECPISRVKLVIGHKGSLIKKLMSRTKTLINFHDLDPNNKSNDGLYQLVEIKGYAIAVANAKLLIRNVIDYGPGILDDDKAIANLIASNSSNYSNSYSNSQAKPVLQYQQSASYLAGVENSIHKDVGQSTYLMTCPSDKISIVIGSKGIIIKEIQKRSNALISIADESPLDNLRARQIEIKGTSNEITMARQLIQKVVQGGPSALQVNGDGISNGLDVNGAYLGGGSGFKITQEIACPKDKVGAIIGSKGSVVRDLTKQTGATINVNEEHTTVPTSQIPFTIPGAGPSIEVRIVVVKGYVDEVNRAVQLIENILKAAINGEIITGLGDIAESFSLADSKGGASSGVNSVALNSSSSAVASLLSSSGISSSSSTAALSTATANITETMLCPVDRAGEIIGKKGVIVKQLRQESNAVIMLVDYARSKSFKLIEIKGTADQCAKGKVLIAALLSKNKLPQDSSSNSSSNSIIMYRKLMCFSTSDVSLFKAQIANVMKSQSIDTKQLEIYLENEKTIEFISPNEEMLKRAVPLVARAIEALHSAQFNLLDSKSFPPLQSSSIGDSSDHVISFSSAVTRSNTNNSNSKLGSKLISKTSSVLESPIDTSDIHIKGKAIFSSPSRQPGTFDAVGGSTVDAFGTSVGDILDSDSDLNDAELSFYDDGFDDGEEDDLDYNVDEDCEPYGEGDDADDVADDDNNEGDEIVHHTIPCPNDKVGLIIGSKGIVIKSMMSRSKAKILVSADTQNGKTTRFVEITGTEKQVREARVMVDCVIKHGQEALDQSGDASLALGIMTKFVDLTEDQTRVLIGPKSSVLRSIIKESKAGVVVGKANTNTLGKRRVSIKGTVEEVASALDLLRGVVNDSTLEAINEVSGNFEEGGSSEDSAESDDSDDLIARIPNVASDFASKLSSSLATATSSGTAAYSNIFAANNNNNSNKLNSNNNSNNINNNNSNNNSNNNKNDNKSSKKADKKATKDGSTPRAARTSMTMQCPLAKVGSLIGTRGSVIREIMKRTNTAIVVGDIPDASSGIDYREVIIRGTVSAVSEADKLIQGIIDVGTKILSGV